MLANILEKAGLPEISGPNRLLIRFPVDCTLEGKHFQEHGGLEKTVAVLRSITGQLWTIQVELAAEAEKALPDGRIGNRITELRKSKWKWSQAELAAKAGVSQATISRIEGLTGPSSKDVRLLAKVAKALDEPLVEILPEGFLEETLQIGAEDTFLAFCPDPFCTANTYGLADDGTASVSWTSKCEYSTAWFDETNFCAACGSDLVKECSNCKRRFGKTIPKFCVNCGNRIRKRPTQEDWENIGALAFFGNIQPSDGLKNFPSPEPDHPPRHTIDAAVIGFTEGTGDRQGMMHDLLVALMRPDGTFHILGRVGAPFSEDERRRFFSDLKDMVVDSDYTEVNEQGPYQMVRPEWVIEISARDLIAKNTRGVPISRMVLNWNKGQKRYVVVHRLPLVAMIVPQYIRRREDKGINPTDLRLEQVIEPVKVPLAGGDPRQVQSRGKTTKKEE